MKRLWLPGLCALFALACSADDADTTGADATPVATDAAPLDSASSRCIMPLVRLQTSSDSACGGGNEHLWPVGLGPMDCHGWRAVDTGGQQHDNSASDIKCNPDGSFSFTQHAGNLSCSGSGVTKTYTLNSCEQDTPPTLYTMAVDLTCCTAPTSSGCVTGEPSVSVPGGAVFLNGSACSK